MGRVHLVFNVSMLRKYHPDVDHVVELGDLEIDERLAYEEVPIRIVDRPVKNLRNREIGLVKVLWNHHGISEATWEMEKNMRDKYPQLFTE